MAADPERGQAATPSVTVPKVAILLATYAGAWHLPEQLRSLVAQQGVTWHLFWRDDGSPDATVPVMEAFAAETGRVTRVAEPAGRLGPGRSFLALLAAAPDDCLVAFCDQDDVWLPGKLERAAAALGAVPAGRPALYCARQHLVDETLAELGPSAMPPRPPGFANALVQNIVTGCTMVLNPAARRLVLSVPMPALSMHDWWCYLLVSGCGGTVVFDPEPVMLYRQHGANLIGARANPWRRAIAAMRRGPALFLDTLAAHLRALEAAPLDAEARRRVEALRGLSAGNPLRRLWRLRRSGAYRQGLAEGVLLRLWVALWRMRAPGARGVPPAGASGPAA